MFGGFSLYITKEHDHHHFCFEVLHRKTIWESSTDNTKPSHFLIVQIEKNEGGLNKRIKTNMQIWEYKIIPVFSHHMLTEASISGRLKLILVSSIICHFALTTSSSVRSFPVDWLIHYFTNWRYKVRNSLFPKKENRKCTVTSTYQQVWFIWCNTWAVLFYLMLAC